MSDTQPDSLPCEGNCMRLYASYELQDGGDGRWLCPHCFTHDDTVVLSLRDLGLYVAGIAASALVTVSALSRVL